MRKNLFISFFFTFIVLITACTNQNNLNKNTDSNVLPENFPTMEEIQKEIASNNASRENLANVNTVSVDLSNDFPRKLTVNVTGTLPNPCYEVGDVISWKNRNIFTTNIYYESNGEENCIQVEVPFEKSISIPILGLDQGDYSVNVNDVLSEFSLDRDNE